MPKSILRKYSITAAILIVIDVLITGLTAMVAGIRAPSLLSVAIGLAVILAIVIGVVTYKGFTRLLRERIEGINGQLEQIIQGNSLIRLREGEDEFGTMEAAFNLLLKQFTDMSSQQVDSRQLVDWAKQELRLKDQLMEKSRALEETNRKLTKRLHERDLMLKVTESINSKLSLNDVLSEITQSIGNELEMKEFVILLTSPDTGYLNIAAVYGLNDPRRVLNLEFKQGEGIVGQVLNTGAVIYVRDVRQEPGFMHYKGRRRLVGSFLAIPIMVRDKVGGVLGFMRPKVDGFSPEEIAFLKILANQVNIAIQNARSYENVRRQADYDQLTGLMSRRSGMVRLRLEFQESLRKNLTFCLIMLDIDNFKSHNDTYGHLVGDKVLRQVAHFIRENIRKVDIACRYGGEEVLIGLHRTSLRDGVIVAEKIRASVNNHDFYPDEEKSLSLSVSQGVSAIDAGCKDFIELTNSSDQALLAAKSAGKNIVYVCTPQGFMPGTGVVKDDSV